MLLKNIAQVLLPAASLVNAQFSIGTYTSLVGGLDTNSSLLGNYYNYWIKSTSGIWDLTRSALEPTTSTGVYTIPCHGSRKNITIEASRSALVIIDMQNFFLHPGLSPKADAGRGVVSATVNMITGFRKAGVKVLWTNWGLDNYDLITMPPAFLDGFSNNHSSTTTFGSDMGIVPGTNISAGAKLMRGSWNARPYGPLYDLQVEGVKSGTDLYFNKNRLSGLWGAQTPLGLYLQENEITTLFFGGVNADQCVWGTFLDAYYKGFDIVFVEDIAATTSPYYATQMVVYNANLDSFLANSTEILPAVS
ncbi:Isochorismatase hydrolase [Hyaloscypha bicolor E]|uniref:Isochorismatase hydrolase n=1 Tax=Hyaloscypha bicolor E TaxID=1095630 RepID=A0A2J6STD5_9HELO|nr:Isochorismatase hydrolase [Hyaloscypha bicolor E]PMD54009.1 Isochorismatase hydrolase [Hyaloscypha bicolor E]